MYQRMIRRVETLQPVLLLAIRFVLAYGFYTTCIEKWKNISDVADWFASLHIPAPYVNAYLSASVEAAGVVLLVLGLGTRIIVLPLMILLIVAIATVHWSHGFEAGNNGFEIPLYYLLLLGVLLVSGGGKFSADFLLGGARGRG
jgi:putative oxidoreductase